MASTPDIAYMIAFFLLGACIGSFLNVVVWRLPRGESLVHPPSHCPKCEHRLAWYDNVPVLGWIALAGKCRYCKAPISIRYPLVEAATGLLFVLCYWAFFIAKTGPCIVEAGSFGRAVPVAQLENIARDWWVYGLAVLMISALLAASLIDAELFIIPIEIPYIIAGVALLVHATQDRPTMPGSLNLGPWAAALSAGAGLGLLISFILWLIGKLPASFPKGEPLLDVDREAVEQEMKEARRRGEDPPPLPPEYTSWQIRAEMGKEMLFLLPAVVLGMGWMLMVMHVPAAGEAWQSLMRYDWLTGLLGSLLGAMVGAFIVWLTRILGTLVAGRVAMGLGDVHLMFGVGAAIGAWPVVIAFFIAPFFGLLLVIYKLITRSGRELPYGPYLSAASVFVLLLYCPIAERVYPSLLGLGIIVQRWLGVGI